MSSEVLSRLQMEGKIGGWVIDQFDPGPYRPYRIAVGISLSKGEGVSKWFYANSMEGAIYDAVKHLESLQLWQNKLS